MRGRPWCTTGSGPSQGGLVRRTEEAEQEASPDRDSSPGIPSKPTPPPRRPDSIYIACTRPNRRRRLKADPPLVRFPSPNDWGPSWSFRHPHHPVTPSPRHPIHATDRGRPCIARPYPGSDEHSIGFRCAVKSPCGPPRRSQDRRRSSHQDTHPSPATGTRKGGPCCSVRRGRGRPTVACVPQDDSRPGVLHATASRCRPHTTPPIPTCTTSSCHRPLDVSPTRPSVSSSHRGRRAPSRSATLTSPDPRRPHVLGRPPRRDARDERRRRDHHRWLRHHQPGRLEHTRSVLPPSVCCVRCHGPPR